MKANFPVISSDEYLAAELAAGRKYSFQPEGTKISDPDILSLCSSSKPLSQESRAFSSNDCCSPEEQDLIQEIIAAEISIAESLTRVRPLPCHFNLNHIAASVLARRIIELGNAKTITPTLFLNPPHPSSVLAELLEESPCVVLESREIHYLYQNRFLQPSYSSIYRERLLAEPHRIERLVREEESDSLESIQGLHYPDDLRGILQAFGDIKDQGGKFNFIHLPWWSCYDTSFVPLKPFNQVIIDATTLPEDNKASAMIAWALKGLDIHAIKNKSIIINNAHLLSPIISEYINKQLLSFTTEFGVELLSKRIRNSQLCILSGPGTHSTPQRQDEASAAWREREVEVLFEISQEQVAKSSLPLAQLDLLAVLLSSPATQSPSPVLVASTQQGLDRAIFEYLTGRTS